MKILVWGTGTIAKEYLDEINNDDVIGFIETVRSKDTFYSKPVYGIDEIPQEYDYIVVANIYGNEIYNECLCRKMNLNKIIFAVPFVGQVGLTDLKILKEVLTEKLYSLYCAKFGCLEGTWFEKDKKLYTDLNVRKDFKVEENDILPFLSDKYDKNGATNVYFFMDIWGAQLIHRSGVKHHFDIGSRVDGFIAHLLSMDIDVTMIDCREFPGEVEGLSTIIADATELSQVEDNSLKSISALHSLEHFGLGRYGDPIDPEACFKCFDAIQRKLQKGGNLYLAVPLGRNQLRFNGARYFYPATIVECFNNLTLKEFSWVTAEKIVRDVDLDSYEEPLENAHRTGLFHFIK